MGSPPWCYGRSMYPHPKSIQPAHPARAFWSLIWASSTGQPCLVLFPLSAPLAWRVLPIVSTLPSLSPSLLGTPSQYHIPRSQDTHLGFSSGLDPHLKPHRALVSNSSLPEISWVISHKPSPVPSSSFIHEDNKFSCKGIRESLDKAHTQVKPSQKAKAFKPSNPDIPCLPTISVP